MGVRHRSRNTARVKETEPSVVGVSTAMEGNDMVGAVGKRRSGSAMCSVLRFVPEIQCSVHLGS